MNEIREEFTKTFGFDPKELLNPDRKSQLITFLITKMLDSERIESGLMKAKESVERNNTLENTRKMLGTTMKILSEQQTINRNILLVLMVYLSGSHFNGDATLLMSRVGVSQEESLQELLRQKMQGE